MHPLTHLLASWSIAEIPRAKDHDRTLIAWAGVLPDLDGAGIVLDLANQALGRPPGWLYGTYHHALFHGLPAALVLPGILALFSRKRWRVLVWGILVFHFHLFCDLLGSRGPRPEDVWPISYLAPLSDRLTLFWSGQWPLNGWPNTLLTGGLLLLAGVAAVKRGRTPVRMFSTRADKTVVETIKRRWLEIRSSGREIPRR